MTLRHWIAGLTMSLCISIPIGAVAGAGNGITTGTWFITPEEAAMPQASELAASGGAVLDVGREDINVGPLIEVLKPLDGGQVSSPVEVAVRFIPRLEPIDIASLRVSIVKFLTIDITDRVKPHATAEGIQVKEARIPSGKHRVRIAVSDAAGGTSVKEFSLEVF